jgi:hypothetical protein
MTIPLLLLSIIAGIVLGLAAGAIAGWRLAGKDLGESFAALMGGLFSSTAVIPGVVVGLLVLFFIS